MELGVDTTQPEGILSGDIGSNGGSGVARDSAFSSHNRSKVETIGERNTAKEGMAGMIMTQRGPKARSS